MGLSARSRHGGGRQKKTTKVAEKRARGGAQDEDELPPKKKKKLTKKEIKKAANRRYSKSYRTKKKKAAQRNVQQDSPSRGDGRNDAFTKCAPKAPGRARQRAVRRMVVALPDTPQRRRDVIGALVGHPEVRSAADEAGIVPPGVAHAAVCVAQALGEAMQRGQKRGREAAAEPAEEEAAAAASPTAQARAKKRGRSGGTLRKGDRDARYTAATMFSSDDVGKLRKADLGAALGGLSAAAAGNWFAKGQELRPAAMGGERSFAPPERRCGHAVSAEMRELCARKITSHESVNPSPLTSHTCKVRNKETGKWEDMRISHSTVGLTPIFIDAQKDSEVLAFCEERGESFPCESVFRSCKPKQIKPMASRLREFCGCKKHIEMRRLHHRMLLLRAAIRAVKPNADLLDHPTLDDAVKSTTCPPPVRGYEEDGTTPVYFDRVKLACAEGTCTDCPKWVRKAEEWTEDDLCYKAYSMVNYETKGGETKKRLELVKQVYVATEFLIFPSVG